MASNDVSSNQKGLMLLKVLYDTKEVNFKKTSEVLSEFKIITREKALNDELLDEKCINFLIECSAESYTEAQKCLSNLILNYHRLRKQLIKPYVKCVETRFNTVIKEPQKLPKNVSTKKQLYEVLYYDLRIIFLLTALCDSERDAISEKLLTPILKLTCKEADDLSSDNYLLIIEALKTLFNLTMNKRSDISLTIAFIEKLFSFVGTNKALKDDTETDNNSHLNNQLLVNLIHLLTNMPKEVYEKLSDENVDKILNHLNNILSVNSKQNFRDSILPVLNVCANICKYNEQVRLKWFKDIIESTKEFDKRPEEYDNLKGRLVKLMTSVDVHIKDIAADFLHALCGGDTEKLITYTGFGNSVAFLSSRGLLSGQTRSDSSENPEYQELRTKINPITGKAEGPRKNPMEGMSEEEKEYHAQELATAITKLTNLGIVKPMQVNEKGVMTDLQPNPCKENKKPK